MTSYRAAYTLVECLVAVTLTGTTIGTISLTLHGLQRAEHRLQARLNGWRTLDRFSLRWRSDLHEALSVETSDGPGEPGSRRLRLTHRDGSLVDYAIVGGGIRRTVLRGGTRSHQDDFPLSLSDTARWTVDRSRDRPLVTLSLPWHALTIDPPPIDRIDAAAGLAGEAPP